jgi:hypothetical protein
MQRKGKTMDIREHLAATRDDLAEIETLTRNLGLEPSLEEIETVVRKRDSCIARMKQSEHRLTQRDPLWNKLVEKDPKCKNLFEESRSLLHSVADLDGKLSILIESRMAAVKQELSFLYHASRAAYSYTAQTSFRAAR